MRLIDAEPLEKLLEERSNVLNATSNGYEYGRVAGLERALFDVQDAPTIEERPQVECENYDFRKLQKAFELACKAIYGEIEFEYCEPCDSGCRKGNIFGEVWDDNKCVDCCMEYFLKRAESEAGE